MGRTSLREALVRLERDGPLTGPAGGMFATSVGVAQASEIFAIPIPLESHAAALAAAAYGGAEVRELEEPARTSWEFWINAQFTRTEGKR